jgi:hypothetical protein
MVMKSERWRTTPTAALRPFTRGLPFTSGCAFVGIQFTGFEPKAADGSGQESNAQAIGKRRTS